jgi:serine/threonine protein kinase
METFGWVQCPPCRYRQHTEHQAIGNASRDGGAEAVTESSAHSQSIREQGRATLIMLHRSCSLNDESGGIDTDAQTTVNPLTSSGSSAGTIAYMSPEQAHSEPLDARSDLFSLGVVLYEVATGRHPFSGASTAVVFDHILNHAPVAPISLNAQLPAEFEYVLNKTLEKDRDIRCQTAAELRAELKRLQRKGSSGSVAFPGSGPSPAQFPESGASYPSQTSQPSAGAISSSAQALSSGGVAVPAKKGRVAVGIAALLTLAIGFAAWRFWPRPQPFASVSVSQITNVGTIEKVALSADGKFLAEVKNENGQRTLWLKNTAANTDTQILSANGGTYVGLIKPAGIFIVRKQQSSQQAKILDFGLAKQASSSSPADARRYVPLTSLRSRAFSQSCG